MRRAIFLITLTIIVSIFTACSFIPTDEADINIQPNTSNNTDNDGLVKISVIYNSFEDAVKNSTDVVTANYIDHRPFGKNLTEFEFVVLNRVLGNSADTIFIYAANDNASIIGSVGASSYNQGELIFDKETNYLLVLRRLEGATLRTHEDGFTLIHNLIINLDNPVLSTMYNEPLSIHSSEMDFESRSLAENQIITFISNMTVNNPPAREHIRSNNNVDIIDGSQYVFVVEINEPRRLVSEQATRDWMETDIYFCTAIKVLKGEIDVGYALAMIFFADTVNTGEQYIVAAERLTEGSNTFTFTSKNSLFNIGDLDEIMMILGQSIDTLDDVE
jgi:hypothetical protein